VRQLSKRLQTVADLCQPASRLIDIGTDHGMLPIYVLLSEKVSKAVAIDRSENALFQAARNKERYDLEENLELRLSNGLQKCSIEEGDILTISGMGGTNIIDILSTSTSLQGLKQCVVQPQTEWTELRRFFCENGWKIDQESFLQSKGHNYLTISYVPEEETLTEKEMYIGKNLPKERSSAWLRWVHSEERRFSELKKQLGERFSFDRELDWLREEIRLEY